MVVVPGQSGGSAAPARLETASKNPNEIGIDITATAANDFRRHLRDAFNILSLLR